MIRHQKTTIFAEAKETTPVHDVKKIVEGIMKRQPEDVRLYKEKEQVQFCLRCLGRYLLQFYVEALQQFEC